MSGAIRILLLGSAIIGALCVGAMAADTPLTEKDLAGRWNAQNRALTLDIAPCGGRWCGVQVADGVCGATVLQLDPLPDEHGIHFTGRLELAAPTQPYVVRASLVRLPDGTLTVHMIGNTGPDVELFRRTFPFSAMMVRLGEPACAPSPKTS
jgi:hypothetical protein